MPAVVPFFSVFFFPLPPWVSWFLHFLLPARKTPFAEDPVNRESVVVSDNETARACLFFSLSLSLFLLLACCLRKASRSLQTTAEAVCRASYPNCLHKQLAEFLKLKNPSPWISVKEYRNYAERNRISYVNISYVKHCIRIFYKEN